MLNSIKRAIGMVAQLVTDHNGKLSAGRLLLFFWTWKYATWVSAGIVEVPDRWIILSLLFGPGVAMAFKVSPVEVAKAFFGKLR